MNISIYNNDCLDEMENIGDKSIDLILCDLPYGTTQCYWDVIIPFDNLWAAYNRIIKDNGVILLFGNEPFSQYLRISNIKNYKYDIYWEKERLTNIHQVKRRVGKTVECISVFYKNQCVYNPQMVNYFGPKRKNQVLNGKIGSLSDNNKNYVIPYNDNGLRYPTQVWKYKRDILKQNLHPTQKPVKLLEDLIKTFSNENDVVLDNCMGQGSTAIACINTNRNFIGIELDKEYYNVAKNRIIKYKEDNNIDCNIVF